MKLKRNILRKAVVFAKFIASYSYLVPSMDLLRCVSINARFSSILDFTTDSLEVIDRLLPAVLTLLSSIHFGKMVYVTLDKEF